MRKLKLVVWMLLIYLFQTVFCGAINFNGTAPDLLLAFAVIFAFYEWETNLAALIIILCGVLAGSEAGRVFPAAVLVTGVAGLMSRALFKTAKLVPEFVKIISVIIVAAFSLCSFEYFTVYKSISVYALLYSILPYVIYTTLAASVMYPLIKKTLFRMQDKKQLII